MKYSSVTESKPVCILQKDQHSASNYMLLLRYLIRMLASLTPDCSS